VRRGGSIRVLIDIQQQIFFFIFKWSDYGRFNKPNFPNGRKNLTVLSALLNLDGNSFCGKQISQRQLDQIHMEALFDFACHYFYLFKIFATC
jgi:hypothetical protein